MDLNRYDNIFIVEIENNESPVELDERVSAASDTFKSNLFFLLIKEGKQSKKLKEIGLPPKLLQQINYKGLGTLASNCVILPDDALSETVSLIYGLIQSAEKLEDTWVFVSDTSRSKLVRDRLGMLSSKIPLLFGHEKLTVATWDDLKNLPN